ncbi:MAG: DUF4080 domain-containing protein [Desulfobacterales bacterium]|nr:DUF4080 domain-containing protein [Desulfobacterales bacterium]
MNIKLIGLNARYVHSSLALFHVRQELARHLPTGRVALLQFTINDPYYPTLLKIAADRPEALFFSVYVWNALYVKRLVIDLAALRPGTRIVLGGPQAPFLFSRSGDRPQGIGLTVVRGEVEQLDPAFYEDLAWDRLEKEYQPAPLGATSHDFASPYLEGDFHDQLANRYIYYESSRGCPFACSYCLSAPRPGVRHKDLGQVRSELAAILVHNPRTVRFVDRTFNDRPERALAIWQFLLEQPGETLFHFEVAPDRFTTEMLDFLATVPVGRFQFELGIQSTNPRTLAAINRTMDLDLATANIGRLLAYDSIHLHLDLILGLPHEDFSSYGRSFNHVFSLLPHYIQMGLLKVLPETPISREQDSFELTVCREPPYEVLASRWLDQQELAGLYWFGECVEKFFNNRFFRTLWRYLRGRGEDGFAFFFNLAAGCREQGFFDLAPTQELMNRMLLEMAAERTDQELFRELLALDWLRSGHHLLPDNLAAGLQAEPMTAVRNRLWRLLPQNWDGVYDYRTRDAFFKQGRFARFSGQVLQLAGLSHTGESGVVRFGPAVEPGVFSFARTILIPHSFS